MTAVDRDIADRRGSAAAPQRAVARLADFWYERAFFWSVRRAWWLARLVRDPVLAGAWLYSSQLRCNTLANARQLLGEPADARAERRLARALVARHYDFLLEFGRVRHWSAERFDGAIEAVEGEAHYHAARSLRRGLIAITAHLGSFEVALAAFRSREPAVHVVFRRDANPRFERLRSEHRQRLGVRQVAIDDGLAAWAQLRQALQDDETVIMQADRAVAGQRSISVPFFGRPRPFPSGPARLALLTGAPLLPVFAPRGSGHRVRIIIDRPLLPPADGADGDPQPLVRQVAAAIERVVRRYPDQWLVTGRAWPGRDGEQS